MFKPKRKRSVTKRATRDESDDEDDIQDTTMTALATKKAQEAKRKKKKRLKNISKSTGIGLSFSIDEGDYHDTKTSKKKKKKKGKGFGFGGMQTIDHPSDNDAEGAAAEKILASNLTSGYSKDDLDKLKSQQKVYVAEKDDVPPKEKPSTENKFPSKPLSSVLLPPLPTESVPTKPSKPEEDFISFHSAVKHSDGNIMNGDDALKYMEDQNDDLGIEFTQKNGQETKEIDEEESKWEDEVVRRAGFGRSAHSDSNTTDQTAVPLHRDEGVQAVAQIKQTIATTLDNLQQQELDLNSNMIRKKHDAHVADEDATKKELEVSTIGQSFEYYQNLRSDLADWTGALRHLSEKVDIIEGALENLYQDIGSRRMSKMNQWEDDAISVLKENGYVDYIVGRQPIDMKTSSETPTVDEFGRDMKHVETLAISKRKAERRRRRRESCDRRNGQSGVKTDIDGDEYEDTDADISDNELMDRGERRCALGDAIQVALDEMDEDFASLASLLDLFQRWQSSHPDDFRQCYAGLSIVDFISVFARCEFCKNLRLLCFGELEKKSPALEDFDWFSTFISSNLIPSKEEGKKNQPLHLLVEKVCFASIKMCVKGTLHQNNERSMWSYDPFSKRQTESLSSFCKSTLSRFQSKEKTGALATDVCDYINDFLQQKAIVVIKRESDAPQSDTEEFDAYSFACLGQLRCLRKLVINILKFWYPVFSNSVALAKLCIADIMAFRFLPVIERLERGSNEHYEKAKEEFDILYRAFNSLGLLVREELMMIASPIRAYAEKLNMS